MPRSRSISIQSETVPLRPSLACTAPARIMTLACRASASVSVDLPASGWLMTANDRRLLASPTDSGTCAFDVAARGVDDTAPAVAETMLVLIGLHSSESILRALIVAPDLSQVSRHEPGPCCR